MPYKATIGLEIHAELKTKTKMFCASLNDSNEAHPNINICPVCTGHPGTLPVINKEAVKLVQRVGLALGGELQKYSQFDRKNYFYPDLPKGYQISQYKHPLVFGGSLHGVRITRIHLEEDTARLAHGEDGSSLVDFNRAGVPLMELVTEPDLTDAKSAKALAEELQLIFQYVEASDANMERGQMRCEANVSVFKDGADKLSGTKVEVKNLNSFKSVEKAIEFEIKRQTEMLNGGGKVVQETRGWDETKEITFSQRAKETEHDYRYFPEPDLPPLEFSDKDIEKIKATLPELPGQKRKRFREEYGIDASKMEVFIKERDWAAFWEKVVSELENWIQGEKLTSKEALSIAANYFTSDLLGIIKDKLIPVSELLLTAENFAELIKMIMKKEISSRVAKDVLKIMVEEGGDPSNIVQERGLGQVSDSAALEVVAKKILDANPNAVSDYKKGKQNAIQFLVGQVMRETKGAANPEVIKEVISKLL